MNINKFSRIKKVLVLSMSVLMLLLVSCSSDTSQNIKLTEDEKIEDFEYLYKVIEENYPYLEVNKRLNNIDWLANKEKYIERVKAGHSDYEFLLDLDFILNELNNGHTHMIKKSKEFKSFRELYSRVNGWQKMNLDVLNNKKALKRYKVSEKHVNSTLQSTSSYNSNDDHSIVNASIDNIVEGKVGYIAIPQMISPYEMDNDKVLIDKYLNSIKDYKALVIDIRGNGGGDDRYWSYYLVPKLIDRGYTNTNYTFWKDGDLIKKFFEKAGMRLNNGYVEVNTLDKDLVPKLPPEILTDFKYYSGFTYEINPKDSINFKGNIYLLVDKVVYSSAEGFASFAKSTGFATLIGERTGGDGIGSDPLLEILPNSGYIFRFTKEMGLVEDGTCNEEFKTMPNYEVDNPKKLGDFSKDNCIKKVLDLEEMN